MYPWVICQSTRMLTQTCKFVPLHWPGPISLYPHYNPDLLCGCGYIAGTGMGHAPDTCRLPGLLPMHDQPPWSHMEDCTTHTACIKHHCQQFNVCWEGCRCPSSLSTVPVIVGPTLSSSPPSITSFSSPFPLSIIVLVSLSTMSSCVTPRLDQGWFVRSDGGHARILFHSGHAADVPGCTK